MSSNNFQYALVARGTTPLAEYAIVQGNTKSIAIRMLENLDPSKEYASFDQDDYVFMAYTDPDRITYLCLTQRTVSAQLRKDFLINLQRTWKEKYRNQTAGMRPYSKTNEFQPDMESLFTQYNSERAVKMGMIKDNIAKAQEEMTQNLNEVLVRGDKLEVMESNAENIKDAANAFHREATKLRNTMCLQKYRWYFLGVAIALVLIFVIVVIACGGFTFAKCKKQEPKPDDTQSGDDSKNQGGGTSGGN